MNPRYLLTLLFLINLLNFYDRQILAVVTEPIRREWNLTDTQIGWMGTAFTLLYAAVGLPLGRLADTMSRTRLLAWGVAAWSAFTAMSGMAWGYGSLFLARMGVGVGEASCSPASNSLIGDLFPPARRARAIALFMLGLPLGIFLTSIVSGAVARSYGWRMAFFVATVPGVVLAILIARVPDLRVGQGKEAGNAWDGVAANASAVPMATSWLAPFRELWNIRALRWLVISGALHNFNAYAVSAFLPALLMRWHGMSLAQASVASGITLGAVGVVSLLVGGAMADRARARGVHARLQIGVVAFAIAAPAVLVALMLPRGASTAFIVLISLSWLMHYVYYVTVYPTIHDVVRPQLRGTAMALYFFWMYVLGGAFGTFVLGMLSDRFAQSAMRAAGTIVMTESARATGLHRAFYIVPVMMLGLVVVLYAASRELKRRDATVHPLT